jgi:Raf kinase inhibitor-like YbhB/YbcL family protein
MIKVEFPEITGQMFPKTYTCEGDNISPAIRWAKVEGAITYALIMEDPDAPAGTFIHWIVYNIKQNFLPKDFPRESPLAEQGINDFKRQGYDGPCPPRGHGPHHYHFKVFALSSELPPGIKTKADLLTAMQGKILDQGEAILIYQRK